MEILTYRHLLHEPLGVRIIQFKQHTILPGNARPPEAAVYVNAALTHTKAAWLPHTVEGASCRLAALM